MDPLTLLALGLLGGGMLLSQQGKGKSVGKGGKEAGGSNIPADLPQVSGPSRIPTMEDVRSALRIVAQHFGTETAEWVERIWRKETAHFRQGFAKTNGAGMHAWANTYPWGWGDARHLWDRFPQYRPIGWTYMTEGGTKLKRAYLVFETPTAFALTLATILRARAAKYGSLRLAAGSWYSKDPAAMASYASDAAKIIPKITREIV